MLPPRRDPARPPRLRAALALAALSACAFDPAEPEPDAALDAAIAGDASTTPDAGSSDAGPAPDAEAADAGAFDTGEAPDAGPPPPRETARLGDFTLTWSAAAQRLEVTHPARPGGPVLAQAPGLPLAQVGTATLTAHEERGSFDVETTVSERCPLDDSPGFIVEDDAVALRGPLEGCAGDLEVRFSTPRPGHLAFEVRAEGYPASWVQVNLSSPSGERVWGFGEQFTHLDLKGHTVPILAQEGGIGRGRSPITEGANLVAPGSGGGPFTSYAPMSVYLTSERRALCLDNLEYTVFDLEGRQDSLRIEVFADHVAGRAYAGGSLLELLERHSEHAGRMPEPPAWMDRGAIVGMQGGTDRVRGVWGALSARGAPVAAFWLQDWVGKRTTSIGSQLWWNWVLDEAWYPGWSALVSDLAAADVRVLGYINPFLVDVSDRGGRNLYAEALANDYVVNKREPDGTLVPYPLTVTDFPTVLVDLSNPAARAWLEGVIRDELLGAGLSGWMADFAEALPFDAVLHSGEPASRYHNRYPVEWAALNRAAIEGAGRAGDVFFFNRAGHTKSPGSSTAFWLGDQMVTWDGDDGFASAVKGMLSGGMSGISLNHSDIGGYTSISFRLLGQDFGFTRERRLLERWTEANAFTAFFRTHEGNQPEANAQFYDDSDSYDFFTRFSHVYAALAPYRRQLFREAAQRGWPVVRHPALRFPNDEVMLDLEGDALSFMLGDQLLVFPVFDKDATSRRLYLPPGHWQHLWTGDRYGSMQRGTWHTVAAPVGQPPVFFEVGSTVGAALVAELELRDALD